MIPCAQDGFQALLKSIEMWSPQLFCVEPFAVRLLKARESRGFQDALTYYEIVYSDYPCQKALPQTALGKVLRVCDRT